MTSYHSTCPACDTKFIGATDADMVEHFISHHTNQMRRLSNLVGIEKTRREKTCEYCGMDYVSYGGAGCPKCEFGGPPYE